MAPAEERRVGDDFSLYLNLHRRSGERGNRGKWGVGPLKQPTTGGRRAKDHASRAKRGGGYIYIYIYIYIY